jgi:hypothetical protein
MNSAGKNARHPIVALVVCAAMLAAYAWIALAAASQECATYDEPVHLVSSYLVANWGEYRCDPENPALFKRWVALGLSADSLHPDASSPNWRLESEYHPYQTWLTGYTLYQDPSIDPDAVLWRARMMMTAVAVLLGALIGWWTFQLGGSAAAIVATAAFSFNPNFLAHGPLVKNDVMASLAMVSLFYCIWRAGHRATPLRCLLVLLALVASLTVKFSGVLVFGIATLLLLGRAILHAPWFLCGRQLDTRWSRFAGAIGLIGTLMLGSWIGIWAIYGFHFGPAADRSVQLDFQPIVYDAGYNEYASAHPHGPALTDAQELNLPVSFPSRLMLAANAIHLLPQAFLVGQYYTYELSLARDAFLCGDHSVVGWWYYFPLATLFKTPLALLAAGALATAVAIHQRWAWLTNMRPAWTVLCLLWPPGAYLLIAMQSHVNAGVRHILPVYAFANIVIGLCAAAALRRWTIATVTTLAALGVCLLTETLSAYPHYVAYFNVASGGSRGGISLLGDSNLDWGQDLPMLAAWQKAHPDPTLYLDYFGTGALQTYGVRAIDLRDYRADVFRLPPPKANGVLAVSATILQGIGRLFAEQEQFGPLLNQAPIAVLGGSIYLYRWPPESGALSTRPTTER